MPALQVRDFPQDLYEGLKECAIREHRSLAQQTVHAVEEMLARRDAGRSNEPFATVSFDSLQARQERIEKRKALFARIRQYSKQFPKNLPSPEEMVRESRAELDRRGDRTIELVEGCDR